MAAPDVKAFAREAISELRKGEADLGYMDETMPMLGELLSDVADPEFETRMMAAPPVPPISYHGLEGFDKAWRDWVETFERVHAELEDLIESDDHLVLLIRQVATTRHEGVEIAQPSAMVVAFESNRVVRVEFHLDRKAALRSAGLDPQSS
jgi:hypothetical protein